jgi:hypothetical protein
VFCTQARLTANFTLGLQLGQLPSDAHKNAAQQHITFSVALQDHATYLVHTCATSYFKLFDKI